MKDIQDSILCFVDRGLFPHVALCCAKKAKHVYFTGPPHEVMETIADAAICDGFDNVTVVDSLWDVKNECDAFAFTDIGFSGEQKELVSQNKAVWGHHGADKLETMKGFFLDILEKVGLDVPPHKRIMGFTELKSFLDDNPEKYIKISKYRGNWETFHWRNSKMDGLELEMRGIRLGPMRESITFYVFDPIDSFVEDGTDTWNINGMWPKNVLHAIEKKDRGLIGAIQPVSEIDERVWHINQAMGPVLEKFGCQGPFSTEIRLTEHASYFNDSTNRHGSPPSQLQTKLIKNLPEVILAGAHGECLEPDCGTEPIGAQVLITSDRDKEEWLAFPMPEELREHVCSSFCCEVNGDVHICPNPLENWAGWLVATGSTIEEVVDTMKERKAMLPDGFDCDITSLAHLLKELEDAKEQDIRITDSRIPEPAVALDIGK